MINVDAWKLYTALQTGFDDINKEYSKLEKDWELYRSKGVSEKELQEVIGGDLYNTQQGWVGMIMEILTENLQHVNFRTSSPTDDQWSEFITLHNLIISDDGDSISEDFKKLWKNSTDDFRKSFVDDFKILIELYDEIMGSVFEHTEKLFNYDIDCEKLYNFTDDLISNLEDKYHISLYS